MWRRPDVDEEVVNDYRSRIPSIISDKNETKMFNCDETELFYQAMPWQKREMQLKVER